MDDLTPDDPWYGHVACQIDGSERSWAALAEALGRFGAGASRVSVVYADRWAGLAATAHAWVPDLGDLTALLELWLREELDRRGLEEADPVVLRDRSPRALCAWIRSARPDLVVVVEPDTRLWRLVHGSIAGYLARHAPCRVAVIADSPPPARGRIRPRTAPALRGPQP